MSNDNYIFDSQVGARAFKGLFTTASQFSAGRTAPVGETDAYIPPDPEPEPGPQPVDPANWLAIPADDIGPLLANAAIYEMSPDGNRLIVAVNNTLHEYTISEQGNPLSTLTLVGSVDLWPLNLAGFGFRAVRFIDGGNKLVASSPRNGVQVIDLTVANSVVGGFSGSTEWVTTNYYDPGQSTFYVYGFSINPNGDKLVITFLTQTPPNIFSRIVEFDIIDGDPFTATGAEFFDLPQPTILSGARDVFYFSNISMIIFTASNGTIDEVYVYDVSGGLANKVLSFSGNPVGNPLGSSSADYQGFYAPAIDRLFISSNTNSVATNKACAYSIISP